MTLYCALCHVLVWHLSVEMLEDNVAVTVIDGNAACDEHIRVLTGRTVTEALAVLTGPPPSAGGRT